MIKYNKYLPLFIPLLIYFLLELVYYKPRLIFILSFFIIGLIVFSSFLFARASGREKFWNIAILPSFFTLAVLFFVLILSKSALIQFLYFLNLLFLYVYAKTIYYYLFNENLYKKSSLENLSSYGNFLSFYFFSSAIYGMQILINAPVYFLMISLMFFSFFVVYQVFWANKIKLKENFYYILITTLLLTELAWSVSFLTFNYFILALILSLSYYIIIGLLRFYLKGKLSKTLVKIYLSFGLGAIIIVLLSSRWV